MDDMAVTSKRAINAEKFKRNIKTFWDITNHGPIGWFLGFQIKWYRKNKTLSINQHAYLESLVANWASQKDRHLISGYTFYLGCRAITWSSKKQHIITLSSTESEYIAQMHAAKEALWPRSFICQRTPPLTNPSDGICLPWHSGHTLPLQLSVHPSTSTANSIFLR